jgi:hypothetical protein
MIERMDTMDGHDMTFTDTDQDAAFRSFGFSAFDWYMGEGGPHEANRQAST